MSLQNLFKAIESFEFGARVGVASGFRLTPCRNDGSKILVSLTAEN